MISFTPRSRCTRYLLPCAASRLWGDHAHFRAEMTRSAPAIAGIPGLARNMWSLDPDSGLGTSIYLFDSESAARDFLAGSTLEHLLNGPDVSGISFDLTHVSDEQPEIAPSLFAPAPESRAAS